MFSPSGLDSLMSTFSGSSSPYARGRPPARPPSSSSPHVPRGPGTPPAPSPTPTPTPTPLPTPPPAPPPPPSGVSSSDWAKLLEASKKDSALAALIKQFTGAESSPATAWRRELPKDNAQLLRQLSFNAGEIGMPGGYVGAVQMPSYGSGQQPVNNPDMSKYGQAPGLGEAMFYQQSMKGGMTPISAMSPLGVPEGWDPGGTGDMKSQLDAYIKKLTSSSSSSGKPPIRQANGNFINPFPFSRDLLSIHGR